MADSGRPPNRPVFSRVYARLSGRLEAEGMARLREELLADLAGEVVEVGCGNGLNFPHYPQAVTRIVAVEPERHLRGLAEQAGTTAPRPVSVHAGDAERLPLAEGSVDAAVLCLVMCSLPRRQAALAEVARVLRPGGTLAFLEHVVADTPGLRRVQRVVDATVWPLLMGGCHTATDPVTDLTAAGFGILDSRRFRFPERPTQPTTPHVMGTARRP